MQEQTTPESEALDAEIHWVCGCGDHHASDIQECPDCGGVRPLEMSPAERRRLIWLLNDTVNYAAESWRPDCIEAFAALLERLEPTDDDFTAEGER